MVSSKHVYHKVTLNLLKKMIIFLLQYAMCCRNQHRSVKDYYMVYVCFKILQLQPKVLNIFTDFIFYLAIVNLALSESTPVLKVPFNGNLSFFIVLAVLSLTVYLLTFYFCIALSVRLTIMPLQQDQLHGICIVIDLFCSQLNCVLFSPSLQLGMPIGFTCQQQRFH